MLFSPKGGEESERPLMKSDLVSLLTDLIAKVIFAITTDETRYQINGTLMILNKRNLTLVATDGHRLAYVSGRLEKGASEERIEVIVPRKAFQEVTLVRPDATVARRGAERMGIEQDAQRTRARPRLAGRGGARRRRRTTSDRHPTQRLRS